MERDPLALQGMIGLVRSAFPAQTSADRIFRAFADQ